MIIYPDVQLLQADQLLHYMGQSFSSADMTKDRVAREATKSTIKYAPQPKARALAGCGNKNMPLKLR